MSSRLLQTTAALSLGLFALQPLAAAAQTTTTDECIPSATVTCPPGAASVPGAESPDGTDDSTSAPPVDPTGSTGGGVSGNTEMTPMVPGSETPGGADDSQSATPVDPSSTGGGVVTDGNAPAVPGAEQPDGTDDSQSAVPAQ
ncbi:hypothetical protein [Cereibacter sediminicola]|uniref:hypothetical protein n=1 Tax=Cereibacter sediminicola TaxID=2584941 RepID=UPI0011A87C2A|nr:hypothetical protein [Cereibacter sediminicola]